MKLILFYAHSFFYKTAEKSLPHVDDINKAEEVRDATVIFFQFEEKDTGDSSSVLRKLVKNIKWHAGKFNTKNVVLHSFNHLSMSKASPEDALLMLEESVERLKRSGYNVIVTPFGYFHEFKIHVGGESLAKVFKEF